MGIYINEEHKRKEIIEQSRHQFIYGLDGDSRTNFLKEIEKDYPVVMDSESPMAVYIEDYGLPTIECNNEVDNNHLKIVCTEFFSFSVLSSIMKKYKENNNDSKNDDIIDYFDDLDINDLEELIKIFDESKEFYKKYYEEYLRNGASTHNINEIRLPFIELTDCLERLKEAINSTSYFALLIDNKKEISIPSTQVINLYVGSRINNVISMKIATEPNKWNTYLDSNGQYVQSLHDYGDVQLDDSLKKELKREKKNLFRQDL